MLALENIAPRPMSLTKTPDWFVTFERDARERQAAYMAARENWRTARGLQIGGRRGAGRPLSFEPLEG